VNAGTEPKVKLYVLFFYSIYAKHAKTQMKDANGKAEQ
jgi:hypothetical protein